MEDVERADESHVIDEIREVARSPAAIEVADEGRPTDRAEDQVAAAEGDVTVGVPRVQRELVRRQRHE